MASDAPSRAGAAGRLVWRGIALATRHPIEIAIALALGGGGGWIAWNALAVQTSRHPAPLFGEFKPEKREPRPPARPAEPLVTVPKPVTREAPRQDAIGDLIRQGEIPRAPRTAEPVRPAEPPARPALQAPKAPPPAPPRDPIGDLIRSGDEKPAAPSAPPAAQPAADPIGDLLRSENPVPPAYVGRADSSALVASGQRALVKLGFGPLKADGLMGPSTRQAIERFERERKLPVTGEFGPRTARELALQSGLPVE